MAPTIKVTTPNKNDQWLAGNTYAIKWAFTDNPGPNVKIELLKNNIVNLVIISSTINNKSYTWAIPLNQTLGTDYKIRITSTSNSSYTDTSDYNFSITSYRLYWIGKNSSGLGEQQLDTIILNGQKDIDGSAMQDLSVNVQSPINITPIPLRGSSGTIGITYVGCIKEIRIEGTFIDNMANISRKITALENLMDGKQKATDNKMGYWFKSGLKNEIIRVAILDFRWNLIYGTDQMITYSMTLKQIGDYL